MSEPTTPYTETEALIAVMRGDEAEALRLTDEMTRTERMELLRHAEDLVTYLNPGNRCRGCDRFLRWNEGVTVGPASPRIRYCAGCNERRIGPS